MHETVSVVLEVTATNRNHWFIRSFMNALAGSSRAVARSQTQCCTPSPAMISAVDITERKRQRVQKGFLSTNQISAAAVDDDSCIDNKNKDH